MNGIELMWIIISGLVGMIIGFIWCYAQDGKYLQEAREHVDRLTDCYEKELQWNKLLSADNKRMCDMMNKYQIKESRITQVKDDVIEYNPLDAEGTEIYFGGENI